MNDRDRNPKFPLDNNLSERSSADALIGSYRKMMEPMEDLRQSATAAMRMSGLLDSYRKIMEPMEHFSQSATAAMRMSGLLDSYRRMMEPMEHFSQSATAAMRTSGLLDSYRKMMEPMEHLSQSATAAMRASGLLDNYQRIVKSIEYSRLRTDEQWHGLSAAATAMAGYVATLPTDNIAVSGGFMSCGTANYAMEDVKSIVDSILKKQDDLTTNISNGIERIISEIKKKDPFSQKIIWSFFVPFILLIMGLFLEPIIKEQQANNFHQGKKTLVKSIKNEVSKLDINETLHHYRFVTVQKLYVRRANNKNSKCIGFLYFGDTVLQIDKKRHWCLIEWKSKDQGEAIIRGWVFSRYLEKFN